MDENDLRRRARKTGFNVATLEKDYALTWLLSDIYQDDSKLRLVSTDMLGVIRNGFVHDLKGTIIIKGRMSIQTRFRNSCFRVRKLRSMKACIHGLAFGIMCRRMLFSLQ
jgi:hypothetical protein